MRRTLAIMTLSACFLVPAGSMASPTVNRNDGNCNREGNCNDQRRCSGDGCRGSFSPGPFDRSPIDIHDNQVCISPNCSGSSNSPTTTTTK